VLKIEVWKRNKDYSHLWLDPTQNMACHQWRIQTRIWERQSYRGHQKGLCLFKYPWFTG